MSGRPTARLGRGLTSLIPQPPSQPSASTAPVPGPARTIPVEMLEPSPYQPRVGLDAEDLAELTQSVRATGILQPLLVRPSPGGGARYQIIAGERRWRAAQAAGLHEVPALVRELSDSEAMAAGLVENLQRADLNAVEEALGYKRLTDEFEMTHETLARAVGKSRGHVGNTMRLLKLPPQVQQDVVEGRLSAGHARALLLHPDPARAARSIIEQGLNVRQTEALCSAGEQPRRGEPVGKAEKAAEVVDLERRLSSHLGLRVAVAWNGRKGRVSIDVESLDQLDGLAALLGGSS